MEIQISDFPDQPTTSTSGGRIRNMNSWNITQSMFYNLYVSLHFRTFHSNENPGNLLQNQKPLQQQQLESV